MKIDDVWLIGSSCSTIREELSKYQLNLSDHVRQKNYWHMIKFQWRKMCDNDQESTKKDEGNCSKMTLMHDEIWLSIHFWKKHICMINLKVILIFFLLKSFIYKCFFKKRKMRKAYSWRIKQSYDYLIL